MTKGLSNETRMTTKEVARSLNTSAKVILENARKCLPNKHIANGKPTYWSKAEVTVLLDCLKNNQSNHASDLYFQSKATLSTDLTPALMIKQAMELAQRGYELEIQRIEAEKQKVVVERDNLQVELDKSKEWTTLQRYFDGKGWKANRTKLSKLSKRLGELGYERKKIYSVEYNNGLWSYRVSDLDGYFLEPAF